MPQIAVIPTQHWNFKAIPDEIDIPKILKEAEAAGDITVVRVEAKFASGRIPYLFVLQSTSDYAVVAKELVPLGGCKIQYTVQGFQRIVRTDHVTESKDTDVYANWGLIEGKDKVNAAVQKILRNRTLLYKPQRVTVACI